ncbi:hypothetical protein Agub_g5634 [Astrephomene gubernaculifera]|uniref:Uncharacterized protein n=1 Tax=Astrephomene gubernaculifera TaxID=47775 RepID=A0AAD3DP83_9CHLO|nr:hypothetical protein Agub_g5634 [Astrephomene gubernaculifera]
MRMTSRTRSGGGGVGYPTGIDAGSSVTPGSRGQQQLGGSHHSSSLLVRTLDLGTVTVDLERVLQPHQPLPPSLLPRLPPQQQQLPVTAIGTEATAAAAASTTPVVPGHLLAHKRELLLLATNAATAASSGVTGSGPSGGGGGSGVGSEGQPGAAAAAAWCFGAQRGFGGFTSPRQWQQQQQQEHGREEGADGEGAVLRLGRLGLYGDLAARLAALPGFTVQPKGAALEGDLKRHHQQQQQQRQQQEQRPGCKEEPYPPQQQQPEQGRRHHEQQQQQPVCGLIWQGPLGGRCGATLRPYGKYGCEVELSYIDGGSGEGSASSSFSSAAAIYQGLAIDQAEQQVVAVAAECCRQVGRRLVVHRPHPLSAPACLAPLDSALAALQRCVEGSLGLLEGALLAQHRGRQQQEQQEQMQRQQQVQQQEQQRQQQQYGKPTAKQPQQQPRPALLQKQQVVGGAKEAAGGQQHDCSSRAGAAAAVPDLQAALQEVLQLQLQLSAAMEGLMPLTQ